MAVQTQYVGNWRGDLEASLTNNTSAQTTTVTLLARIGRRASGTLNTYTYGCQFGTSSGGSQLGSVSGSLDRDGWTSANQVRQFGSKQITTVTRTRSTQTLTYYGRFRAVNVSDWYNTPALTVTIPAKDHYTVSYNANGGSGAPASQTKWYGESLTLQSGKPTRSGYMFMGWNTASDGSGTTYQPSATYTGNAAVTLYAMWKNVVSVKVGGTWKTGEPKVKVNGTWKNADGVWVKVGGTWKST